MYRDWRNMASDYVMMMVLMAASFALYLVARREAAGVAAGATSQRHDRSNGPSHVRLAGPEYEPQLAGSSARSTPPRR